MAKFKTASDDPFIEIGTAVAKAKEKLDDIPQKDFDALMRAVDLYMGLKYTLEKEYGMLISTNASLKMYELIIQMRLISCESGAVDKVRAFCDAELPGAFIVAINHYVKTMCPQTTLDWVGSSYYPEAAILSGNTNIFGDHYGIYASNRDNWLMGPTPNAMPKGEPAVTGDLTDSDVVSALADAVHARFSTAPTGATLYTSDAGIDVSSDFNRQEELTAAINFGQVLCGILSLAPGGHLVTKQYTFVTPFTRSLIALCSALFDEMYVVKPLTSRPVNSEVYLVGKGFRGIDHALADALLDRLAAYRAAADTTPCDWTPLLDPSLTADIDSALLRVARQIHERQQVSFLNEAVSLYHTWKEKLGQLRYVLGADARRVQEDWLAINPVRRIRPDQQLPRSHRGSRGGANTADTASAANMANTAAASAAASAAANTVRILAKRLKSGIATDARVVQSVYPDAEVFETGQGSSYFDSKDPVDVQFHLEHYLARDDAYPAQQNYIFVNQEFLFDWDIDALRSGKATALCKTRHACDVLDSLGIKGEFVGFSSPDIRNESIAKDPQLIVHLAGLSWLKGTLEVLQGWFEHGGTNLDATLLITHQRSDYAPLTAVRSYWESLNPERNVEYRGISGLEKKDNVYFSRGPLSEEMIAELANAAPIHLCPSIVEGWGHIIDSARSVGAVIITTDAAPMNELVDSNCGFLAKTDPDRSTTVRDLNPAQIKYYPSEIADMVVSPVDEASLMEMVKRALALSADERSKISNAIRARYEGSAANFSRALKALVNRQ